MNSKEIGNYGEKITAFYLEKKGYKIIGRNYCIRGGEIDIIAVKDDELPLLK
jgi:putative endonuclease